VDDSVVGILVFGTVTLLVSLVCHRLLRSFALATLVSGPVAALLFQILVYLQLGYLDPFFLIAFFVSTLIAWVISFGVGSFLRVVGLRDGSRSDDTPRDRR